MQINVLTTKPSITINEKEYIDLSINSLKNDNPFNSLDGIEIVSQNYAMRPDLICLKLYGNTSNIDMLLKANNIFNPFSINEEDILIIPSLSSKENTFKQKPVIIQEAKKDTTRSQFFNKTKLPQNNIDKIKEKVNNNKDLKNKLKNSLPPNMLAEGVNSTKETNTEIILTNGK